MFVLDFLRQCARYWNLTGHFGKSPLFGKSGATIFGQCVAGEKRRSSLDAPVLRDGVCS